MENRMFDEIKELLVDELSLDPEDVTPEAQLNSDLGINSIEMTDLLLLCEERYGITIEDDDAHGLLTVGDIVNYLEKKK